MSCYTSPFPKLPSDDSSSTVRTRLGPSDLELPVSTQKPHSHTAQQLELPHFPNNPDVSFSGPPQPSLPPLEAMPVASGLQAQDRELRPILKRLSRFKTAPPSPSPSEDRSAKQEDSPRPSESKQRTRHKRPHPATPTEADEFKEAFFPLVEEAVQQALYAPQDHLHSYLEPMLRQTVRRAIAEQMDSAKIFRDVGTLDRLFWHLSALVSSRTYDEIVFDKTRRYQIEELFLYSHDLKWLLSYASHDPARHGSPRRIKPTVRLLRSRVGALRDQDYSAFDLPEGRLGVVREGQHTILVAVMRGRCNALIRADLDYLQHQIEERYGRKLRDPDNVFQQTLQPILESGLLIQAPPAPE